MLLIIVMKSVLLKVILFLTGEPARSAKESGPEEPHPHKSISYKTVNTVILWYTCASVKGTRPVHGECHVSSYCYPMQTKRAYINILTYHSQVIKTKNTDLYLLHTSALFLLIFSHRVSLTIWTVSYINTYWFIHILAGDAVWRGGRRRISRK